MIEQELRVIYNKIEDAIKQDVLHYVIDNELNHFGGYHVTVYGNEENNIFYYRYELSAPEQLHFFSEWFSEEFNGELKQFFTVDYLNNATINKDIVITNYDEYDFSIMQN